MLFERVQEDVSTGALKVSSEKMNTESTKFRSMLMKRNGSVIRQSLVIDLLLYWTGCMEKSNRQFSRHRIQLFSGEQFNVLSVTCPREIYVEIILPPHQVQLYFIAYRLRRVYWPSHRSWFVCFSIPIRYATNVVYNRLTDMQITDM